MNWLTARSGVLAISIVSALILLGLGSQWGITASTNIMSTNFNYGQVMAVGMGYISFLLWKRYI